MALHDRDASPGPGFHDVSRAPPVGRRFDRLAPARRGRFGRRSMRVRFDGPISRLHLHPLQEPAA
jgi:hypothetical protein